MQELRKRERERGGSKRDRLTEEKRPFPTRRRRLRSSEKSPAESRRKLTFAQISLTGGRRQKSLFALRESFYLVPTVRKPTNDDDDEEGSEKQTRHRKG